MVCLSTAGRWQHAQNWSPAGRVCQWGGLMVACWTSEGWTPSLGVARCMPGMSSTLRFHRAQTAASGKTTPTADTKEEPPKCSGSWDITEMPHQKGKEFLTGGTAHRRYGQKYCPAKTLPPAQMSALAGALCPVTALTFTHKIKTRLANIPNGTVKLITLEGLETHHQQEPAPAPEPLQKSRIQETEKPLSFP